MRPEIPAPMTATEPFRGSIVGGDSRCLRGGEKRGRGADADEPRFYIPG